MNDKVFVIELKPPEGRIIVVLSEDGTPTGEQIFEVPVLDALGGIGWRGASEEERQVILHRLVHTLCLSAAQRS